MIKDNLKYILIAILAVIFLIAGTYVYKQFGRHAFAPKVDQSNIAEIEKQFTEMKQKAESGPQNPITIPSVVASGDFIEIDFIHKGSGVAKVYETSQGPVVRFENFSVTDGPDLFVYLTKDYLTTQGELGEFVNLGKLQSPNGDQSYLLPKDYQEYNGVVVWCRAFGVLFTSAKLK